MMNRITFGLCSLMIALALVAGPVAAQAGCGTSKAALAAAAADNAFADINPDVPTQAAPEEAPVGTWAFVNGRLTNTAVNLAAIVANAIAVPVAIAQGR